MKTKTPILSRCLAMLLALVLSFANVPGLVLTAFAAEATSVNAGKVMADNYTELSDAEKAILKSGYLVGDESIEYESPEKTISVDVDEKVITAPDSNGWKATTALIKVGEEVKEEVTITDGEGRYEYGEKAFSVEVIYVYKAEVAEGTQEKLLNAVKDIQKGIELLEIVKGQEDNLGVLVTALPEMADFAENGVTTPMGNVGFAEECKVAVDAFNAQISEKGKLNLAQMIEDYSKASKTAYLASNGDELRAEVVDFVQKIHVLNTAFGTMVDNLAIFIQNGWMDASIGSALSTLQVKCAAIENGLADTGIYYDEEAKEVKGEENWPVGEKAVITGGNADLDEAVQKVTSVTEVEIETSLTVETTTFTENMSMKNVTVNVVLETVNEENEVAPLEGTEAEIVVTFADNTEKAEMLGVIEGKIEEVVAGWEAYEAYHYEASELVLPDVLTEDYETNVTYSPKYYKVTGDLEETLPYGYKFVLPVHETEGQAYDYTVDGEDYAQGEIITIVKDVEIYRTSGKSYTTKNLYSIIADNYGDAIADAILTSGALKGDEVISYRKPDPADASKLVGLKDGVVTAAPEYKSDYNGYNWAPYSYGAEGTGNFFAEGENTAAWTEDTVKVVYRLDLENYSEEEVQAILDLAKALKDKAEDHEYGMDRLKEIKALGDINGTLLKSVRSIVKDREDFREEAKTAIVAAITDIVDNNVAENGNLTIYNMVSEYSTNGLAYYYKNYNDVYGQVVSLKDSLEDLIVYRDELLVLMNEFNYGEYIDMFDKVKEDLGAYIAYLEEPNYDKISTADAVALEKFVKAVTAEGETSSTADGVPYVLSEGLLATDESQTFVLVKIEVPGNETITINGNVVVRGTVVDEDYVADLEGKIEEALAGIENIEYYKLTIEGKEVSKLLGDVLNSQITIIYNYTAKEYVVRITGEEDRIVTVDSLTIELPEAPAGYRYEYTIDGEIVARATYTFKPEQLGKLFSDKGDGVLAYAITRETINIADEEFENNFGDWEIVKDEQGKIVGLKAKVDANKEGIMSFATTIVESGYSYIGLNGKALLRENADGDPEIVLQTLIDALMADVDDGDYEGFSSERIIKLGKDGKGLFVRAIMDLGSSAENIAQGNIEFELYLTSLPAKLATVAKGLEEIRPYMTFESARISEPRMRAADKYGLDIAINLPEKVYEVYLAALLATDTVDKNNIDEINSKIAYQFLWDYIELITSNDDITVTTFNNTLAKLNIDKDITGADEYYKLVKKALSKASVTDMGEDFGINVTAAGKDDIDALVALLGVDISSYESILKMICEYKTNADISADVRAHLGNTTKNFEAALVDIKQPANKVTDHLNKFDFTDDLAKRANTIAGEAAIILLDDIGTSDPDGKVALEFNDATIIDLNGHTINGTVKANGKVLIFDSSLDTYNCGGVTGAVTGNATIVGGVYGSDVTAFLPDGYVLDGNTVRNALYTNEEDADGNVIFNIDANVINAEITSYTEAAAAIAADMAVDLVLNYFTSASLKVEEYSMYEISVEDIIGLYASTNRKEALINEALDFVSLDDLNGFINYVIDELMDFAAVEKAIRENSPILTLDAAVSPWYVSVEHEENGDYLAIGIVPNPEVVNEFSVGLRMAGTTEQKAFAANLIGGLSDIVVTENNATDAYVEILRPSYSNKHLSVSGTGYLNVTIDITEDQNEENELSFTNEEYLNVFAVVVANGISNNAKKAALVDAVAPNGEMDFSAMKAAIDALTAKELFDALKNMSVSKDFAAMCQSVGVDAAELGDAATLEQIYHLVANAAGEVLEYFEVTGPESKLGNLYKDGYYQLSGTRSASKDVSAKGYTLTVGAEEVSAELKVKLYPEIEEPEDCVHKDEDKNHVCDNGCGENVGVHEDKDHDHECDYGCDKPIGEHKDSATDNDHVCDHGCGEVLEECTPAEAVKENEVDATCSAEGSYDSVVYCEVCGEELSRETITTEKVAHTWKDTVYSWTETGDGMYCTATRECDVCGEDETRTVKAVGVVTEEGTCVKPSVITYTATFAVEDDWAEAQTKEADGEYGDHSYKATITKAPDCDDTGVRTYVCEHNAEHTYTETIPALGHDFGPWKVIEKPTTKKTGLKERVCEVCGHIETKIIARLDDEDDGFIFDTTRDDEENPSTGAPVKAGSALCAMAILAGAAYVAEKMRKH